MIEKLSDNDTEQRKGGFWQRLKSGLSKTRGQLAEGVGNLLLGDAPLDDPIRTMLDPIRTPRGVDQTETTWR